MEKKRIARIIDRKYVLLDTNIFVKTSFNFSVFEELFRFLEDSNCARVHNSLLKFEFSRAAFIPDHILKREEFFDKIASISLPFPEHLIKSALEIARVYSHQGIQGVSLVDCCIGAYLREYEDNLFLVTLNHKDFPTVLFDRVGIFPIDGGRDVFAPAFYKFNSDKWASLQKKISKAGRK